MDIASMSMYMNQMKVQDSVSLAVTNMVMDTANTNAVNMTEMVDALSTEPYKGENIDAVV